MTIASFLTQRRRLLVFCAATVVLHGLAIEWAARSLLASATTRLHAPVVSAQLRVALPPQTASAPLAEVQPLAATDDPQPALAPAPAQAAAPEAKPVLPPRPAPALGDAGSRAITPVADDSPAPIAPGDAALAPMMMPAPQRGASVSDNAAAGAQGAEAGSGMPGDGNSGYAGHEAPGAGNLTPVPPATSATASAAAAQPAAALAEAAPSVRRYKVQLPPSATFEMDVARVDASGAKWTGAATMTWHTDGSRYQASVEAGVSLLVTRLNLLVLRSAGTIDDHGIAPDKVTEKRARRAETATHFNRPGAADDGRGDGSGKGGGNGGARAGTISFSASERSYPLLPGAQDKATVPFQLAGIGRADVNQFGSAIDIQVGEDKTADIFRFQLVGEEELETKLGKLVTWHLTRPPKPGSYSSRLDIWLAPGLQWYPVQIRNTEASGALTTQTIATIKTEESGK